MKKATLQLETLTCPSCLQKIENATKSLNGVDTESVKVLFNASKARMTFDENIISIEEIEKAIRTVGYEVEKTSVRDA
ncbi:heavy-metal-associated domain-containing protein [Jeotgalibaca sp. MA1X17-3]|uniref:heavy-metal-associated domain-containing protein n=1 Tax=Jeotgalibaca sp. MA1X17-3 TaxID=2908211 RepID=UPI001F34FFB2|nr:heavy-metal-associated domain-containing protein [Jeotgalibaca sp. MA1X17-3]UJF15980.1 heavy-metal-associated domain-containing protein [Jeotgalibaca sp. MA1X17-3]